jgi:hypothetical protein
MYIKPYGHGPRMNVSRFQLSIKLYSYTCSLRPHTLYQRLYKHTKYIRAGLWVRVAKARANLLSMRYQSCLRGHSSLLEKLLFFLYLFLYFFTYDRNVSPPTIIAHKKRLAARDGLHYTLRHSLGMCRLLFFVFFFSPYP